MEEWFDFRILESKVRGVRSGTGPFDSYSAKAGSANSRRYEMPGAIIQKECVDALMVEGLDASVRSGRGRNDTSQEIGRRSEIRGQLRRD